MQDFDRQALSIARRIVDLQRRAVALLRSESTRLAAMQLEQSMIRLISIQEILQLRVQWTPDQLKRQQARLARQQARLQWQQAMLEQLQNERKQ